MRIPFSYSVRNLIARKTSTLLTAGGMALVVFVLSSVLMLDHGLHQTLVATGAADNIIVIRSGAETEIQSAIDLLQTRIVETKPSVQLDSHGLPVVSREIVVLISLDKRGTHQPSNVLIRGMGSIGLNLRPQAKLSSGRMFRRGSNEIVVGRAVAARFAGTAQGEQLHFGGRNWTVVGTFDTGGSGFDSEIWGDVDQLGQAFHRETFSSLVVKLNRLDDLPAFRQSLQADRQLTLQAKQESVFYAEQSQQLSQFILYLGITMSVVFSLAAVVGAMITMYAAVANRVGDIATLRALGFKPHNIVATFFLESCLIALLGWGLGCCLAALMVFVSFSTTNFQSFSELAFRFSMNGAIAAKALLFALTMGLIGGCLPALRAARVKLSLR